MNYYLSLLDDALKEKDENPSIGIILCTSRDKVDIEFALRDLNKPIGISGYKLSHDLPKEIAGKLSDPQKLEAEILKELGYQENKKKYCQV